MLLRRNHLLQRGAREERSAAFQQPAVASLPVDEAAIAVKFANEFGGKPPPGALLMLSSAA